MKKILCLAVASSALTAATLHAASPAETANNPLEFKRQFLSKKDFSGQNLADAKFFQVRMNEADFRGANLKGAFFQQCDLSNANFQKARFDSKTRFVELLMNDSNFEGTNFQGAQLDSVNFRGADLRNTKNYGVVSRTTFDGADLRGADLSKLQIPLVETTFRRALYDNKTKFPKGFDPAAAGAVLAAS